MYRKFHKLRVRFAELDLSQAEAARRAGIPPSTLTARMTGRLPFTARDIAGLCKALDIPTSEIGAYFFEDEPKPKAGGCSIPEYLTKETAQPKLI